MAFRITSDCNLCDACVPECPNEAISAGASIYTIDPSKCTECVGFFDQAQCAAVCPQECCDPDPDHMESEAALLECYCKTVQKTVLNGRNRTYF